MRWGRIIYIVTTVFGMLVDFHNKVTSTRLTCINKCLILKKLTHGGTYYYGKASSFDRPGAFELVQELTIKQ